MAALSLFQTRGFDETTTREIARKAGIAEGTVFNYFPTKDDIALHFFEMEVDHAIAVVRGEKRAPQSAPRGEAVRASSRPSSSSWRPTRDSSERR